MTSKKFLNFDCVFFHFVIESIIADYDLVIMASCQQGQ